VFDTSPYIMGITTQVNVVQIMTSDGYVEEYVSVQRSNTSEFKTRLVFQTFPCSKICAFNSHKTRRLSSAYRTVFVIDSKPDLVDLSDEAYLTIAADIVQSVEDRLDTTTNTQLSSCLNKIPSNIASCSFTAGSTVSSLSINDNCGDDALAPFCTKTAAARCESKSKEYRCSHFISYDGCVAAQVACGVSLLCVALGKMPDCNADCRSESDFSACMADYETVDKCKSTLGIQCYSYGYQQIRSTVCTATQVAGGCPYTMKNEALMKNAGLPVAGFCPDCISNLWTSCSPTKSSQTYALVEAANTFHAFQMQSATTGTLLPSSASHFSMKLGAAIQCGAPQCAANQRAVQLYKNMFTCIECFTVPTKFCSGNHLCRFLAWGGNFQTMTGYSSHSQVFEQGNSTYAQVSAAVKWVVSALLNQSFPVPVGVLPQWMPFLDPYEFSEYNPESLKQIFNANVESLGTRCVVDTVMPDLSQCQNDLPRTTLRSFVQSQYKIKEGIIIPAKTTLSWFVSKAQMLSTNIVAWSALPANPFFTTLFSDKLCSKGTMDTLICMKNGTSMLALNPVMSGNFEVQQGCDIVDSVVDGLCNQMECGSTNDGSDVYNTFSGTNYFDTSSRTRCGIWNSQTSQGTTTSSKVPINLCSKLPPVPATCDSAQGMIGQTTWDGSPVSSLYARQRWPDVYVQAGLLSGKNPLLAYQNLGTRVTGNITLDPWDIGGHYIRMVLANNNLRVAALPLRSYTTIQEAASLNSTDWVKAWKVNAVAEIAIMSDLYAMRTCQV